MGAIWGAIVGVGVGKRRSSRRARSPRCHPWDASSSPSIARSRRPATPLLDRANAHKTKRATAPGYCSDVGAWGVGSFENDAASDWFYRVDEDLDPGSLIAATLDDALSDADHLGLELS